MTDLNPKDFISIDIQGNIYRNSVDIESVFGRLLSNSEKHHLFTEESQELHYALNCALIPKELPLNHFNKRFKLVAFAYKTYIEIVYVS